MNSGLSSVTKREQKYLKTFNPKLPDLFSPILPSSFCNNPHLKRFQNETCDFTDNVSDRWGGEIQETESTFSAGRTLMVPVVPEEEAAATSHSCRWKLGYN